MSGKANRPAGVVVKDIAIGTGGLGFDSQAGQIGYIVTIAIRVF